MKTFEDKIEDYFNEFINHPSSDNYYFFRGYVSAMFVSRNISEDQFDEYLEKARLVYYEWRSLWYSRRRK